MSVDLGDVPDGSSFWTANGLEIKNLSGLLTTVEALDADTYAHHVGNHKNDFREWVQHAVRDASLAKELHNHMPQEEFVRTVKGHLYGDENKDVKVIKSFTTRKAPKPVVRQAPAAVPKTAPVLVPSSATPEVENAKINEILRREREIELKEDKIREVEDRIEKQIADIKKGMTPKKGVLSKGSTDAGFFSKEFIQGLVAGLLLSVLGVLVWVKFFG